MDSDFPGFTGLTDHYYQDAEAEKTEVDYLYDELIELKRRREKVIKQLTKRNRELTDECFRLEKENRELWIKITALLKS